MLEDRQWAHGQWTWQPGAGGMAGDPTLTGEPLRRHSVASAQLQEKLAGAQRQLGQLRAQEAGLQQEQRKADTHKKMTEF